MIEDPILQLHITCLDVLLYATVAMSVINNTIEDFATWLHYILNKFEVNYSNIFLSLLFIYLSLDIYKCPMQSRIKMWYKIQDIE